MVPARALTFPHLSQEYMGNACDGGQSPTIHERLKLLVFDGFRLVTLHFARFIVATIARRKVIVIDFNHDDSRGVLAAGFRDTAR